MSDEMNLRLIKSTEKFLPTKEPLALNHYTMVHPCVINGIPTLVYPRKLQRNDARSYQRIVEYANRHGLILKEDQRANFLEGVRRVSNNSLANLVPIMFLGATLVTQNLFADTSDMDIHNKSMQSMTQSHESKPYINLNTIEEDQSKLMIELMNWINGHSSFYYSRENLPDIKKVSTHDIAMIAFGDDFPKAMDLVSLKIFGLYNFNEKTIYLHDSVDLQTEKGKSILLHELVHFLQYQYGHDKDINCKNELESLAYMLEAKYLHDQKQEIKMNSQVVNQISQCRG